MILDMSTFLGLATITRTLLVRANHLPFSSLYLDGTLASNFSELNDCSSPLFAALLILAASTNKITSAFEFFPSLFSLSIKEIPVASISLTLIPVSLANYLKTCLSVL